MDALILEGAPNELSGGWSTGFFYYGSGQADAVALMATAGRHGLPRIAYLNSPAGRVPLFLSLARAADHVIVASTGAHGALKTAEGRGHAAAAAIARPMAGPVMRFLQSLLPFGLRLCGVGEHVHPRHLAAFGPLTPHVEGNLTAGQLQAALTAHDVLVQVTQPDRDEGRDWQLVVNAAAARYAVVVLGALTPDDPRHGFAHVFEDPAQLRGFLSRLSMQPIQAEKVRQQAWRCAHRNHCAHHLVQTICGVAELASGRPLPRASMVTPTYRSERLKTVIETFRVQSWPDCELIAMANTDTPDA